MRETASTQSLTRRIVDEYLREDATPPAATLVAWWQSDGRGRRGRSWTGPAGQGVYVSMLRPVESMEAAQSYPLRIGVALCEALNRRLDGRCGLKWPNDLLVGGAKLGGLLIDLVGGFVVIGFGMNHRGEPGEFLPGEFASNRATSLSREGVEVDLPIVTAELILAADAALAADPAEAVRRYRELSVHRPGDILRCDLHGERLEGRFVGFDERGFLRLEVAGVERLLTTGEVFFESEAS